MNQTIQEEVNAMAKERREGAYYITNGFGNCDGKEENLTAKLEIKITNQHFQPSDVFGMLYLLGKTYVRTYLELEKFLKESCEKWEFKDNQWVPRNDSEKKTP